MFSPRATNVRFKKSSINLPHLAIWACSWYSRIPRATSDFQCSFEFLAYSLPRGPIYPLGRRHACTREPLLINPARRNSRYTVLREIDRLCADFEIFPLFL
jgi:hypothetical protein